MNEPGWVDADQVARYLSCDRQWVYRHALELDGRQLGNGPKAPWRFELALVDAALEAMAERATCSPSGESEAVVSPLAKPIRRRRQHTRTGTGVPLLPIRARKPPSEAA